MRERMAASRPSTAAANGAGAIRTRGSSVRTHGGAQRVDRDAERCRQPNRVMGIRRGIAALKQRDQLLGDAGTMSEFGLAEAKIEAKPFELGKCRRHHGK